MDKNLTFRSTVILIIIGLSLLVRGYQIVTLGAIFAFVAFIVSSLIIGYSRYDFVYRPELAVGLIAVIIILMVLIAGGHLKWVIILSLLLFGVISGVFIALVAAVMGGASNVR
jgi:hypothetical protein